MAFHLLSLELGEEEEVLERALEALETVMPGETAFLSEAVAWTASGSGRAFAQLVHEAQTRDINVITSLNLAADLVEDLPGALSDQRYAAVVVFTRHGTVHVPQAKLRPQGFEMDQSLDGPDIGVSPYPRLNRVRLDWDEQLLDARFLLGSDLAALRCFSPATLAGDLLVVLGALPFGGEQAAMRVLGQVLDSGAARVALLVNAHQSASGEEGRPVAVRVEEMIEAQKHPRPGKTWPNPALLRGAFHLYDERQAGDLDGLASLRGRQGKIPVAKGLWSRRVEGGIYPVTVVL